MTTGIRSADIRADVLMNSENRDGRLGPEDHFMLQGKKMDISVAQATIPTVWPVVPALFICAHFL